MTRENEAVWVRSRWSRPRVGSAPHPTAGRGEVVVRTGAVAVNPVDTMPPPVRWLVYPWLRYPTVLGVDVAGWVVEVGEDVTGVGVGDRVIGLATGQERDRNRPEGGAFQHHVVLDADLTTALPDRLALTDAVVLPLAVATAAVGLFHPDRLDLDLPGDAPGTERGTVLVWGGSTSVGCSAIQLARLAGHRVVATAAPHNQDLVRGLGAEEVLDHHAPDAVAAAVEVLERGGHRLVGALAVAPPSLGPTLRVVRSVRPHGDPVRVSSAQPGPATTVRGLLARRYGVHVSAIWGGDLSRSDLGRIVYTQLLPSALADGSLRPAPPADVVGDGLAQVPVAIGRLERGVSGRKLVVTTSS
ncbi:zinc-binding alcohol dehydrogenase family protein [Phycicoccus avicenniae]|uniref:zinc-binding alcohol dehydrogenase family protein n=1 Tax=Phycicoccus avicenniae TaxID=2828860 RepID=UPI003D2776B1